jgi:putative dimethyl sulfoxide reductase chaperone
MTMELPENDMIEMASARANVYGLLADVFREEPSETLLSKLNEPEISTALRALDLSLEEIFEGVSRNQLVEDLALEFTRLFIGPGSHISANESMHVESRFGEPNAYWGPQTVEVKKFMAAAGLEVADTFGGMPDHISAEFEFMQRLLQKEGDEWTNAKHERALNVLYIEKQFYDEHLSQWISNFCDNILEASPHPFYVQFAEVTKGFVEFEKGTLSGLIGDAERSVRLSA